MSARSRTKFISAAIVSAMLLLAADATFNATHPLMRMNTVNLDRSEAALAVKSFRKEMAQTKETSAPEVILLGSSLMVAPAMQSEAMHCNKPLERFHHRRITVVEQLLEKMAPPVQANVYCLAVGGQMASDAYLLTKNVLNDERPKCIIYGVGPRDFQDNLFPSVESSQTFRVHAGFDDLSELMADHRKTWEEKAQLAMDRLSSLFRYRSDLQTVFTVRAKRTLEAVCPWIVFPKYSDTLEVKLQKRGLYPEEAPGTPHAMPGMAVEHVDSEKTHNAYMRSYNPLNREAVEKQFTYFEKFLALCQERKTPVVIVNMPLSKKNKTILPDGFYAEYLDRLKTACATHNSRFVDFNTSPWDEDTNFVDTVHLSPSLSTTFLSEMLSAVNQTNLLAGFSANGHSARQSAQLPGSPN